MEKVIFWVLIFAIPLVAIVGGIVAGIIRTMGRHRLIALAQRERIAAIERGLDPSKLPPLPPLADDEEFVCPPRDLARLQRNRQQGLLIGGIVTLFVGIALSVMLRVLEPDESQWIVGIVPAAVGLALLLSAWIVRPRPENGGGQ